MQMTNKRQKKYENANKSIQKNNNKRSDNASLFACCSHAALLFPSIFLLHQLLASQSDTLHIKRLFSFRGNSDQDIFGGMAHRHSSAGQRSKNLFLISFSASSSDLPHLPCFFLVDNFPRKESDF